jgi:hypothetical protein
VKQATGQVDGFDSRQREGLYSFFAAASRQVVQSTKHSDQRVLRYWGLFSRGQSGQSVNLTTRSYLAPMLRMSGVLPTLSVRLQGLVLKYMDN